MLAIKGIHDGLKGVPAIRPDDHISCQNTVSHLAKMPLVVLPRRHYPRNHSSFRPPLPIDRKVGGRAGCVKPYPAVVSSKPPYRAGNLFCCGELDFSISRWRVHCTTKIRPAGGECRNRENPVVRHFRRRPPGLSQPDASCEHPDVRAETKNLTKRERRATWPGGIFATAPPLYAGLRSCPPESGCAS